MALFVSRGKSMKIEMHAESKTYPIYLERGILKKAKEYIGRSGKVFLISDDGVPEQWRNLLQKQYPSASMYVFKNGEASKNFDTLQDILKAMQKAHVSRKDSVIALGGGVVGDMAGFASARQANSNMLRRISGVISKVWSRTVMSSITKE